MQRPNRIGSPGFINQRFEHGLHGSPRVIISSAYAERLGVTEGFTVSNSTNAQPAVAKVGYSIREACQASSLSKSTIYNHIAAGRLRAVRVGGRTIIPAGALHDLIAGA